VVDYNQSPSVVEALVGAGRHSVTLGLLATADLPADVARDLAEELPALLAEGVSDRVDWRVAAVSEPLPTHVVDGVEMIDHARRRMLQEGWDIAVFLTDLQRPR
jgi:hypothetical protein